MQKTKVVNMNRQAYTHYIGRGSMWGNPFKIGVDGTRDEVVEKYRELVTNDPYLMSMLPSLKGKVLGCFCKPKKCHGDVLVELLEELHGDL
jgi:hypothetical protein